MVQRFAINLVILATAALLLVACGGSPGSSALEASQKRAEKQDAAAAKKQGTGIEAASDTAAKGGSTSTDTTSTSTTDTSTSGDQGGASAATGDAAPVPASVTMATIATGKGIFTSTCGGCHVLKDAGTAGTVGPDLDQLKPGYEHVKTQVEHGGGAMPAGLVSGDDLNAVAGYVATATGATPAPAK